MSRSTAENSTATCEWLDKTFNGDFLPLSKGVNLAFFHALGQLTQGRIFEHLSTIARNYKPVGLGVYQLYFERWEDFNFAHIPVGLLSQVYEKFTQRWDKHALSTSVHYTPRNIAATMVDEVFDGFPDAYQARVLDPACGAGVFLVLAFRRLYSERWKRTGRRPDTAEIRDILMHQLAGFDISTSALKLAALSLYLTAIELDPKPAPPSNLRFDNLLNAVLFNFRKEDDSYEGPVAGSLNPDLPAFFTGMFDIVLSNPPWTPLEPEYASLSNTLNTISKDVINRIGGPELAGIYQNPGNNPDLPFLWKAAEWCRKDGRIAMALHARILLRPTTKSRIARNILFNLLEVNGIINGSNLSKTAVWHNMEQPFMLLFATNRTPRPTHKIQFITLRYDLQLNKRGEMWIDSESAIPIDLSVSVSEPWIWKTLTVGTSLDVEIMRKIKTASDTPFEIYWTQSLGLQSRNGYHVKENQPQRDASHLIGLPDLTPAAGFRFFVEADLLPKFSRHTLGGSRPRTVFDAPLVLVKEAPGIERSEGRALLSLEDVAFNQSYNGYSAASHPEAELLARYIHLFAHSQIWMYYALLTSPKFGAERNTVNKSDFDNCPIVPIESLTGSQKESVAFLSERLLNEDEGVFTDIDNLFAQIYGLDALDTEVINETLEIGLPFQGSRRRASSIPRRGEHELFRHRLLAILTPFFGAVGKKPVIGFWESKRQNHFNNPSITKTPFVVLLIGVEGESLPVVDELLWQEIVKIANKNGASRIFYKTDGGLLIAMVNQYRYWTQSRARLCASEILRHYMYIFEG